MGKIGKGSPEVIGSGWHAFADATRNPSAVGKHRESMVRKAHAFAVPRTVHRSAQDPRKHATHYVPDRHTISADPSIRVRRHDRHVVSDVRVDAEGALDGQLEGELAAGPDLALD